MGQPTTVIIGGGVTGLSTAYHLALKRAGRIVVLEKDYVGSGSSRRAAGIITGLLWSETGIRVRKLSLNRFRELSEELPGYRFNAVGCLNWFDRASWADRERLLPLYDSCGAPYEVLQSDEMQRRWPALVSPEDVVGLYDPLGGYSEPDEYVPALANRCRQLGVEILERVAVQSILTRGDRACGVNTADGKSIESDAVVCASYAWVNQILRSVDIEVPVKSFVHQRYVTRPLTQPQASPMPAVNANPFFGYIRPASGNRLLLGVETADREECKVESNSFQMDTLTSDVRLRDQILSRFSKAVPALQQAEWESERVGLITFSADNEPIVGPVAPLRGLYVGVAFHSGGFAYNPATGMLLSELVVNGKPTSADITAFSPQRFIPSETREYLATTVQQKDSARRRH